MENKPVLKIYIETDGNGIYLKVITEKLGDTEYMGMKYDMSFLFATLNIMLDNSILLSGKDVRMGYDKN